MSGCNCGDPVGHAKAVESAIFQCLMNAGGQAGKSIDPESRWAQHADKLERKFTTDHGRHYSLFLKPTTP